MPENTPAVLDLIPSEATLRQRLTNALREVQLIRRLLPVAEKISYYRECDRRALERRGNAQSRAVPDTAGCAADGKVA
jgi:hypothetical protein